MKKTLAILATVFVLIAALSLGVFALTQNDAGVYEIATADDLLEFRNTAKDHDKAVLTADIDMTGKEWTPFGDAAITIDGNGHTISNLSYTSTAGGNTGLIINKLGHNDQKHEIKNLKLSNCSLTVTASNGTCIGLVAGYTDRTAVIGIQADNCSITVTHTGQNEVAVGALVGRADWGYDNGQIPVSGIVNDTCTINVTAERETFVGGLVGAHSGDTLTISDSVSNAVITAPNKAAYVYQLWSDAIISNCTTNTDLAASNNMDKVKSWFYVGTAEELDAAVAAINASQDRILGIILTADIDYTDKEWTPITSKFIRTFDGAGHTISGINLTYDNAGAGEYGIIVNLAANNNANGTVKNLTLKDCSITVNVAEGTEGNVFVGGIMGRYDRGHADNITLKNVDIALNGKASGEIGVGGICGKAEWAGPINSSVGFFNITVDKDSSVFMDAGDSTNARAGGIVGRAGSADHYEFDNCVNYATVYGSHTAAGIIGASGHWNNPTNIVKNSKNYGNVYGKEIAASLVGVCDDAALTIENCVAGGFISGNGEVYADVRVEATKNNLKVISIVNPIKADAEEPVAGYYQTQVAGEGLLNIRVVFLSKIEYAQSVSGLTVKVVFTKGGETVKTYENTATEIYKEVTAGDDLYIASDDMAMFGNIFTNIPTAEADGFTITVTDPTGATVYTGNGSIA